MKKAAFLVIVILCVFSQILTASADSEKVTSILADMTLEQKIGQMISPALRAWGPKDNEVDTIELNDELHEIFGECSFGGVTLFGGNIVNAEQTIRLINDIQKTSLDGGAPAKLLISIDQEGGYITRLKTGTQMPGNMALGATDDPENAGKAARVIGKELAAQGFSVDFAPVVDVNNNPSNPIIGVRSFSDDPDVIASYAIPFIEGLHESGIISCLKHFPGHGDTSVDSHTGLPLIDKSLDELMETELVPYQAVLPYTDMVMTAHIQFPQIETQTWPSINEGEEILLPATLSKTFLTDLLREKLGFQGVIASDAMDMDATIEYFGRLDAAKLAVNAGIDILMVPIDLKDAESLQEMRDYIAGIADLVEAGEIEQARIDDAVTRILTLKDKYGLLDTSLQEEDEAGLSEAVKAVGTKENHEIEWEIAKAAVTLLKNEDDLLPLDGREKTAVFVPYSSQINSVEYAADRLKAEGLLSEGSEPQVFNMYDMTVEEMIRTVTQAKTVIVVTALYNNAELDPAAEAGIESAIADLLLEQTHAHGGKFVLISSQLPYDSARYPEADAVLACYGARGMTALPGDYDTNTAQYGPNLPAALYTVFGGNNPRGKLPVNIPDIDEDHLYSETVAYERGFGLSYALPEPEELSAEELYQMGKDAYAAEDYAQTLEYYQQAADLGLADAVNSIGFLYTNGNGVDQSWEKALEFFQQAADMGYAPALYNLGKMYELGYGEEQSYEKALEFYQQAADLDVPGGYSGLASLYYYGEGVEQSYEKAVEYLQLSADMGDVWAQGFLGNAYYQGNGVGRSYEKALELFQQAAEQGDTNSFGFLGEMYRDGLGVEQSYEKAMELFQRAADDGMPKAIYNIGDMYRRGLGVDQSYEKALELFEPIAEKGNIYALNALGAMYRDGEGVEPDLEKAAEYFQKAAEKGDEEAAEALEALEQDTRTLIYGSNAEISGDFAPVDWWTNGTMDNMLRDITNDYYTVVTDQDGKMVVSQTVCESLEGTVNEDGSRTFTIRIKDGLLFNNGEPVSAKDFVWKQAIGCTPAAEELGIPLGSYALGCYEYYSGEAGTIKGLRIPDDRTIQITIPADYFPYYYELLFADLGAFSMKYWLGDAVDLKDDGEGVYFTGLTKEAVEDQLSFAVSHAGEDRVSAGPYNLVGFDPETRQATLVRNKYYQGNFEGQKPSIEKIIITKCGESCFDDLKNGVINFSEHISGGKNINKVMDLIEDESVREALGYGFGHVQFDRAEYTKILFQSDYGPTQFTAVRQAIAYLLDREEYVSEFAQGWGHIVNGPYGTGMWMTQQAQEWLDENLNSYPYDPQKAVDLLVEDGWVWDENGNDYTEGIRYKKVTEEQAGSYPYIRKPEDGTLLMGLELDFCSTEGSDAADLLKDTLFNEEKLAAAGMKIDPHLMPFSELLNYYYRNGSQGEQYAVPAYSMFMLSTSFAPQYAMSGQFSEGSAYNVSHNYDEELDRLSRKLTIGVEPGDDKAFLEVWKDFVKRWNEVLPELPLSSNIYITVFPDWLEGYNEYTYWDFDKAILYASEGV